MRLGFKMYRPQKIYKHKLNEKKNIWIKIIYSFIFI